MVRQDVTAGINNDTSSQRLIGDPHPSFCLYPTINDYFDTALNRIFNCSFEYINTSRLKLGNPVYEGIELALRCVCLFCGFLETVRKKIEVNLRERGIVSLQKEIGKH